MELIHRPKKRLRRRGKRSASGVALIFVLTTIAILTAIASDFVYNSRVNLELAAQSRDALRARSLAMSGINMSRLMLHFQKQIDTATAGAGGQMLQMLVGMLGASDPRQLEMLLAAGGGLPGTDPRAVVSATMQSFPSPPGMPAGGPSISLWKVTEKFDSNMILNFINAFPTPQDKKAMATLPRVPLGDNVAQPIEANFGEFTGTFSIKITDEDQKINVAKLGGLMTSSGPLAAVLQLKPLIDNPSYDFIFDQEDSNHDRVSRNETIGAIRDYVDDDDQQTTFDPTLTTGSPLVAGGGDENGPYSRYKPRYRVKNAKLDSVDELRMVHGINDAFMASFGGRLTVYPGIEGKLNINTNDMDQLRSDVLSVARTPLDPRLQNPLLYQVLKMQLDLRHRMLPFLGATVSEFIGLLQADGVQINPDITTPGSTRNFLDNQSTTFRIVSTGEAGRVKKTLTAVVKYDDDLGQLLYWHEE
jgi:general secretion pathway protein K